MTNNYGLELMDSIPIAKETNTVRKQTFHYHYKVFSIARAAAETRLVGDWVQFGVYKGELAKTMLDLLPADSNLYLFDSFEGLQEDWIGEFKAGTFKTDPPKFDDQRVYVVPGFFEDTAKPTLKNKKIAFVHLDADLYVSTLDALYSLGRLRNGTILLFDEYVHELAGQRTQDEHRAITEWALDTKHNFRYLWRTELNQVCVKIVKE